MENLFQQLQRNVTSKSFNEEILRSEIATMIEHWQDRPDWLSGWRHNYFCDKDGTFLTFDITKPFEHACGICGRVYSDVKKNNAWVNIMRNKTISAMRYATLLYLKDGQQEYLNFVRKVILYFAENYDQFAIHLKNTVLLNMSEYERVKRDIHAGKVHFDPKKIDWSFDDYDIHFQGPGKIMGQGLSEGIALIRILFCYQALQEKFSLIEQEMIREKMLKPAIKFLDLQQFVDHNITLWRESAIQIMQLVTGDFKLADLTRPFGIHEHIKNGVTKDGFWYEGSIHYHHYVVEALCNLAYFMSFYGQKDKLLEETIEKMLTASYCYAFDNGKFPNPNDGWPNVNLKTYINVFELASAGFPKNQILSALYQKVKTAEYSRNPLPIEDDLYLDGYSSTGLMVVPAEKMIRQVLPRGSRHFFDSRFSVLKNTQINLFMKYGVQSLSHAHYDPLNFELTVNNQLVSKDLSNAGYGSELVHVWYNTPLGHNAPIIDGKRNNILYSSKVEEASDQHLLVTATNCYDVGEQISREITLNREQAKVCTTIRVPESHVLDVVQHIEGVVELCQKDTDGEKVELDEFPEYHLSNSFVHNIQKFEGCVKFSLKMIDSGVRFDFEMPESTVYVMKTVGNPSTETRSTILIRHRGKEVAVKMTVSGNEVEK